MEDVDDFELLRRYAEDGSEVAFGDLVRRHIGLVYSSAMRQTRDAHDAEDVTQAVFILLARGAPKLGRWGVRLALGGWLMTTTRYVASSARRTAARRRSHERRAAELADATTRAGIDAMTDANWPSTIDGGTDGSQWERIAPGLDEALAELSPRARDALVLRYFQGKTIRETAGSLGISEDAAKRRLSRALGQLRALFGRRGIVVSAFALGTLLSTHGVHAAPPALVAATTAVSLQCATATAGAAGASNAANLAAQKGTVTLMTLIKSKVAIGLTLLTVGGTTAAVGLRALAGPAVPALPPVAAPGGGPPSAAPAGGVLAAPAANQDDSWRKRFDEVYHLDAGQTLRHVPPPFILERAAYLGSVGNIDAAPDSLVVYAWRDGRAEFDSWGLGVPTLSGVVYTLAGVPSYKLDMKLKERVRPWAGDWVVRKEDPEDKKMEAVARVLRDERKWKFHFEKRDAEHDVIVVTGAYVAPKGNPDGMVDVYVDAKNQHNSNAGDLTRFLTALGELCNTEPVNEATGPTKGGVFWHSHAGANLSGEDADKMLANVAAQTGLRFTRARRVTSHWVAVPDAADGAKAADAAGKGGPAKAQ